MAGAGEGWDWEIIQNTAELTFWLGLGFQVVIIRVSKCFMMFHVDLFQAFRRHIFISPGLCEAADGFTFFGAQEIVTLVDLWRTT